MTGYGVCFEFSANDKESAAEVRDIMEAALRTALPNLKISDAMRPSLYEFDTEYTTRIELDE